MASEKVAIEKGTKLVCPLCRKTIGEIAKDLRGGDTVMPEHLTIYGKEVKMGDDMICPSCEFPYAVDIASLLDPCVKPVSVIHTECGWLPRVDEIRWVPSSLEASLRRRKRWRSEWDKLIKGREAEGGG